MDGMNEEWKHNKKSHYRWIQWIICTEERKKETYRKADK
jgi:hypothetical protein